MKTTTKILVASMLLFTLSCTKENSSTQTDRSSNVSSPQILSSDVSELAAVKAVTIGTQVWMAKNLRVSNYRNGDRIPQVTDPSKWESLTTGAWCWYNNDSANGAVYGKLYNWYAVNDPRGLAPEGWHIPSQAEWITLSTYLGKNAGGKMKSTGTIEDGTGLWIAPNFGATNSSGFTGLPGGFRTYHGGFTTMGDHSAWWSSTSGGTFGPWDRNLITWSGRVTGGNNDPRDGMSVRCVKD